MAAIKKTITWGEHQLTIETGVVAKQATGSVMVSLGDTSVLVTVTGLNNDAPDRGFLPLRVDYQEKAYAVGKIPGGFFKREGRPTEREILVCRLIDRPIRPLFPKGFSNDLQVVATVVSLDPKIEPDVVAMIGASAAITLSGIPFNGPMASARVGYKDGSYLLNPTKDKLENSDLELMVAGTKSSVLMVESEASELSESVMLGAVTFGHQQFQSVIQMIEELAKEAGKPRWDWEAPVENAELIDQVKAACADQITAAYQLQEKQERSAQLKKIKSETVEKLVAEDSPPTLKPEIERILSNVDRNFVRGRILDANPRIDGRDLVTVRPIAVQPSFLKRTHGSALFTRGETQAIVTVTLGTGKDAQLIDSPMGDYKDPFMLHYNFPPYSVGEVGMMAGPKRREIGHGMLAKRALRAVLPSSEDFPYVLRVVSEITESNGSSSMATVCGASLALMDAGVPIRGAVAGIAMGLIKEGERYKVLTDILGDEDHLGDMDFKVAGTDKGITALQMDIKIDGITEEIMKVALDQAKDARMHILGVMNASIADPRQQMSDFAPQIISFKIDPEKIRDVIGKGGSVIRSLTEDNEATVDISDDGTIQIAAVDRAEGEEVQRRINLITAEAEVGKIYEGRVVRIAEFGAFVNILPGKDGLVHISQISEERVEAVTDVLEEGQTVRVEVLEIDRQGRVRLSMKTVKEASASAG